jgi:TPR repeat protein
MKKTLLLLSLLFTFNLSASTDGLLKQKCLNDDATACYELGFPLTQGDNAKVQDYLEEGMAHMRKACMYGENKACDVMGAQYYKDKNYIIATEYLTKSCNRGVKTACESVAVIYRDGHLKKFDDVKAREFFTKACELKSGDACYNVAIIYRGGFGIRKSRATEKEFYKKGCDAGLKAGCDRFTELDNEDKGIETGLWADIKNWFK